MASDNPHDALVRAVFGQIEHAAPLLQTLLPEGLGRPVDWSTLATRPGTFVDQDLRRRHTDLLFSVQVGTKPALVYLLFEHQSKPDRWLALRILQYEVRIWEQWREENPRETQLPPVFPVVLYHGQRPWSYPIDVRDLIQVPPEATGVEPHLPRQTFLLADLGRWSDEELQRRAVSALGRITLLSLRDARSQADLAERLLLFSDSLQQVASQPTGLRALERVVRYILQVSPHIDVGTLVRKLGSVQEEVAHMVKTAGQKLIEQGLRQGRQEGRQEGREEGREEGARELLLAQLRAKFGSLLPDLEKRVRSAPLTLLEIWATRLMEARSLDELFSE